jgi:tRNA dimethylallyltransferase
VSRAATIPTQTVPFAVIVAGPTASGKSALALALAERLNKVNGVDPVIINADAMQCYRDLRILTARPTPDDEARVPHALYGVRAADEPGSVAWWRDAALGVMAEAHGSGRLPILTGGTGLYFSSLTEGLAAIPDPGPGAREEARRLLKEIGPVGLHARLAVADPDTAARIRSGDSQRVARAWEVWRGTGRGLVAWQSRAAAPAPWRFWAVLLDPPRVELRAAIATRLAAMLRGGAIEEVRALLALGVDPALPLMRAHGVPELSAYLRGEVTLEEAARRIELVTGQYTKRQATWFRHHVLAASPRAHTIHARISDLEQFSERNNPEFWEFIKSMG